MVLHSSPTSAYSTACSSDMACLAEETLDLGLPRGVDALEHTAIVEPEAKK